MFKGPLSYFATCLIIIVCLCYNSLAQGNCQTTLNYSEEQIVSTLKDFYTAYFMLQSNLDTEKNPIQKIDSLLDRYCTKEFLNFYKNIESPNELDWNPFFNANYLEPGLLETMKISKDKGNNDLYYVAYLKKYNNEVTTIELTIIKEKKGYKINSLPQLTKHIEFVRSVKH
jgi:hypothetical protein